MIVKMVPSTSICWEENLQTQKWQSRVATGVWKIIDYHFFHHIMDVNTFQLREAII